MYSLAGWQKGRGVEGKKNTQHEESIENVTEYLYEPWKGRTEFCWKTK